ncbi:transcription initiation factor IIA small chain [Lodderomyces elongisporus NRRL YB-4239]|uniref:Transcription initiation factor IIA subunit 2 n=1 Tax=Lodderomyces elongisporus (strain ATCC 11503 / CBS 2605 / JCM 1781 / NBRC 1676 / NRRL YB-4239) TaxID=379508 RepID=A5E3Z6_LODEL|nr:transcription initiation factor IIA small chain [Lodderomyces elongisporus NRRL YB-4239]
MSAPAYYELYRRSTIGVTLADALDTLISDEKIQPQLANRILNNFDRIIAENLKNDANIAKLKLTFKGDLDTYRFCDDVWTFIIKNVIVKLSDVGGGSNSNSNGNSNSNSNDNDLEINVDKFKIVACNSRKAGEL